MLPNQPGVKPLAIERTVSGNGPMPWFDSTIRVTARKISMPARVTMNAGMPK